MQPPPSESVRITDGVCHVLYTFDVGLSIDLKECERRVTALKQREMVKHKKRAPMAFQGHDSPPLRITQECEPVPVGARSTLGVLDLIIHDFGAVTVSFSIEIKGPLMDLLALGQQLYEHEELRRASRHQVGQLIDAIRPAVTKLGLANEVEDYVIYEVRSIEPVLSAGEFIARHRQVLAQLLRAEVAGLSESEVEDALTCTMSFADDLAVIDWNAAFLLDREADDVRTVLELVNSELLEMRYLDTQLDDALERSYEILLLQRERQRWRLSRRVAGDLRQIARHQVDSAVLFERISNALKLIGDQYLARVYHRASQRFHLHDWDAAIQRKLQTLESIYQKMTDRVSTRRMELLEWIIIVLIAVSLLLPFVL